MAKTKESVAPDKGAGLAKVEAEASDSRERMTQLKSTQRVTTIVGIVGIVLFMGIILGWSYAIYAKVSKLFSDESAEQFKVELSERGERIWPRLSETMLKVFHEVTPAFSEAFASEMQKGALVVGHEIDAQLETLRANVEKKLHERLEEALSGIAERGREKLKRTFAQLAGKPDVLARLMDGIQDGFANWVTTQLTTTLNAHMEALLDIRTTLLRFQPGPNGRKVDAEEVLTLWLEIVYEQFGGDEAIEPTPVALPKE